MGQICSTINTLKLSYFNETDIQSVLKQFRIGTDIVTDGPIIVQLNHII